MAFAAAYELARTRAAAHRSSTVRAMAQSDNTVFEAKLLERETNILRRNREEISARRRPHYSPADRLEIIQLMRLRGWSIDETAGHFAVHKNTISAWVKELETDPESTLFTGITPLNKIGEAARMLVRAIRDLCPEREFGTRSIAMQIIRAGLQLGRSSVQRILREKKTTFPRCKPQCRKAPTKAKPPHHILRPKAINKTWHLDLTTFEFMWVRFYVAAVLDGYSRKLLALRVYADAPKTNHLLRLVRERARQYDAPRFIVTDHGCQFRPRFVHAMRKLGVKVVKGRLDSKRFNGKVERFFRTLKLWQRVRLLAMRKGSIQRRLDTYRIWYNTKRPMLVLGARTPEEAWIGATAPQANPVLACKPQPIITVKRYRYFKDPHLFTLAVKVKRSA